MASLPRIRYSPTQTTAKSGNITIDFDRGLNAVELQNVVNGHTSTSQSGLDQQATFYDQDFLRIVGEMTNPDQINAFAEFWKEHAKDGRSFEYWRDRDLVAYIPISGKSLETTDNVAATFTRAEGDNPTYHDPSLGLAADQIVPLGESTAKGLLVGTGATDLNIPRFPAGMFGRGIVIETALENLLTESSRFDSGTGAWTLSNVTVTADTTETTDPLGFNAADKAEATAANGTLTETLGTAIGATDSAAFSVWARTRQGTSSGRLIINSTTAGQLSTDSILITNQLKRFVGIFVAANPGGNWEVQIEVDNSGDFWYLHGAQFERGVDVEFATNLIVTQGGTGTRAADILNWTLPEISQTKGTVSLWFKPGWVFNAHPSAKLFEIGDTQRFLSLDVLANGNVEFRMDRNNSSSTGQSESFGASGIISQHTWHHAVVTYDVTKDASLKCYIDGVLRDTATQDAFVPNPTGDKFHLGNDRSSAQQANCVFDDVFIRSDVLTASQVSQIFNNGLAGIPYGQGRNYYSSVKTAQTVFSPILRAGTTRAGLNFQMKEVLT